MKLCDLRPSRRHCYGERVFRLCRALLSLAHNQVMKSKPSYWINSVDHALALAVLLKAEGSLTVTEASVRLGVATSTAHRLLSMLVHRGFAFQDEHRRYHPGPELVRPVAKRRRGATAA